MSAPPDASLAPKGDLQTVIQADSHDGETISEAEALKKRRTLSDLITIVSYRRLLSCRRLILI